MKLFQVVDLQDLGDYFYLIKTVKKPIVKSEQKDRESISSASTARQKNISGMDQLLR